LGLQFRSEDERNRRACLALAQQDRPRFRPQTHPHHARLRLRAEAAMKRRGLSFAARLNAWFAIVVILLSIALFLIAYLLLYRAVQEREREIVRSQLDVYREWYAEGGLQSLTSRFLEREDKESFFVRVIGPEGVAVFASVPKQAGGLDLDKLQGLTPTEAIELDWLIVPTRNRRGNWLVATARLPDGSWLQVGKTTEALAELLAQFRTVFGWIALAALVLGVAGGAWLARRALAPVRQLIGTV